MGLNDNTDTANKPFENMAESNIWECY